MKKKMLLSLLVFGMCFMLVGCGSKDSEKTNNQSNNTNSQSSNTNNVDSNTDTTKVVEYDYTEGVLTRIVDEDGNPLQTDFVINGVILVGNRHSYDSLEAGSEGVMETLVKSGYKKSGINSSFYLNEYIEFYIDTDYRGNEDDVRILVVPHHTIAELNKMDIELLASEEGFIVNYVEPLEDNYKYVNEGYVNLDYPEGKYDILFTYKGKIAYFISINETKEPVE